eukprot:CAMPEP_0175050716 /NCGR_PEP_ID=MMETSP0052_2-20121109/7408_1 /TAXON_ID=51329 ORGANISM="Polytomella parva, Strain SAG 63-3" /NCGR_SAMPLE_ID=MMETSP0052_2 /ASSEMBLY_ACC=CAM_ASM_000194 /LENGTH=226 /DNA_ID=CAMNT_0016314939 /DNA_START=571 /DNA_END=1249 /DNA_ORIENTATION=-
MGRTGWGGTKDSVWGGMREEEEREKEEEEEEEEEEDLALAMEWDEEDATALVRVLSKEASPAEMRGLQVGEGGGREGERGGQKEEGGRQKEEGRREGSLTEKQSLSIGIENLKEKERSPSSDTQSNGRQKEEEIKEEEIIEEEIVQDEAIIRVESKQTVTYRIVNKIQDMGERKGEKEVDKINPNIMAKETIMSSSSSILSLSSSCSPPSSANDLANSSFSFGASP